MELPPTATPLAPADLARVFIDAQRATGRGALGARALAILAGIIGLENARGGSIIQHNWGNISAGEEWRATRDWWPAPELQPGQPVGFRAYGSHAEGARAWWDLMYRSFRPVIAAAVAGQPYFTVAELYRLHYVVGGSGLGYALAVDEISREWARHFSSAGVGRPGWLAAGAGVAGVATTLAIVLWR